MPTLSPSEREFRRVRGLARQLLLEHGCALVAGTAGAPTCESVDDAVGNLVRRHHATVERDTERILATITDPDVARQMSDQHGAIMVAHADAGYFLGFCVGLEMAAMISGVVCCQCQPSARS